VLQDVEQGAAGHAAIVEAAQARVGTPAGSRASAPVCVVS
jgi:ribosomal protein S12 methylthiotransferase accessory factor YcaO